MKTWFDYDFCTCNESTTNTPGEKQVLFYKHTINNIYTVKITCYIFINFNLYFERKKKDAVEICVKK